MILLKLLIFLLGASIGSFAYAFALRFSQGRPWAFARSRCEKCRKFLSWDELIPVLSFLIQKGKCKNCGVFIGWKNLWPEILMGLSAVWLWRGFLTNSGPVAVDLIFWTAAIALFLIIALIDLEYFIIPDKILILTLVLAVGFIFLNSSVIFADNLAAAVLLLALFFALWLITKGNSLGFGDVKLAGVIGFLFGFLPSFLILALSVLSGLSVGVFLIVFKKAGLKTPLPFGFFMGVSAIFYILFPDFINSAYFKIEPLILW